MKISKQKLLRVLTDLLFSVVLAVVVTAVKLLPGGGFTRLLPLRRETVFFFLRNAGILSAAVFTARYFFSRKVAYILSAVLCALMIVFDVSHPSALSASPSVLASALIAWGVFLFARYFMSRFPQPATYRTLISGGAMASCVFLMKPQATGFFAVWLGVLLIANLFGHKKVIGLLRRIQITMFSLVYFLVGFLLPLIITALYLGFTHQQQIDSWFYTLVLQHLPAAFRQETLAVFLMNNLPVLALVLCLLLWLRKPRSGRK